MFAIITGGFVSGLLSCWIFYTLAFAGRAVRSGIEQA